MFKRALLSSLILLTACGQAGDKPGISSSGVENSCVTRAGSKIGGPINLVNQDGVAVTEEDFKGHHSLVFFGFTLCPDVCPFTLNRIYQAIDELPEGVEVPKTIMISIDPERDTPDLMKTYIGNSGFPEDIVGLTGTPEQVKQAADAFIAYYKRVEDPTSAAEYTMDHSALIYLMDENWKLKTFFTHEQLPDEMATCMAQYLPEAE